MNRVCKVLIAVIAGVALARPVCGQNGNATQIGNNSFDSINRALRVNAVATGGGSTSSGSFLGFDQLLSSVYDSTNSALKVNIVSGLPCAAGASGSITCTASGANQNISLLPSGTGASVIGNLQDKGGQVFNAKAYGLVGDGATDNTAAINTLLAAVYAAGGGTILFPCGSTYLFSGQIVLPNNGNTTTPEQPPMRLTGTCSQSQNNNVSVSSGGAVLDFRYSGTYGQLVSQGLGTLEIDHLVIEDNGTGSTPFVYDTNTTLYVHDNIFQGNTSYGPPSANPTKDAIVLGGTVWNDPALNLDTNFRGFGTRVTGNTFAHIRHAVMANVDANGLVITDNMVSLTCGSGTAGDAPFVLQGDGTHYTAGGYMAGNLIEEYGYTYGVKLASTVVGWLFEGNNFYDSSTSTADYDAENSTTYSNTFIASQGSAPAVLRSGATSVLNTVINPASGNTISGITGSQSYFPKGFVFDQGQDQVKFTAQFGPTITNPSGDTFNTYFSHNGSGAPQLDWRFTPSGGGLETSLSLFQTASNGYLQCGVTACIIQSGNGDLRLIANSAGGVTWLGNSTAQPSYFSDSVMHVGTKAAFLGQIQQTAVAYASAPACNSGNEGSIQAITDSTVSTWGSTIAGGGANHVLGYCDGTNWTVGAK